MNVNRLPIILYALTAMHVQHSDTTTEQQRDTLERLKGDITDPPTVEELKSLIPEGSDERDRVGISNMIDELSAGGPLLDKQTLDEAEAAVAARAPRRGGGSKRSDQPRGTWVSEEARLALVNSLEGRTPPHRDGTMDRIDRLEGGLYDLGATLNRVVNTIEGLVARGDNAKMTPPTPPRKSKRSAARVERSRARLSAVDKGGKPGGKKKRKKEGQAKDSAPDPSPLGSIGSELERIGNLDILEEAASALGPADRVGLKSVRKMLDSLKDF